MIRVGSKCCLFRGLAKTIRFSSKSEGSFLVIVSGRLLYFANMGLCYNPALELLHLGAGTGRQKKRCKFNNRNAQATKRSDIAEQNRKDSPGVGNPLLASLLL